MQMISFVFWGLVAVAYALLYLTGRIIKEDRKAVRAANVILLVASYFFAAYADIRFAAILGALTVSTWFLAKKARINLGIIVALAVLFCFKYMNFFVNSFSVLFGRDEIALHLILPIGISFYTFSAISYLMDIKQKKLEVRGFLDVALYLSFFPKFTSGPIQRAGEFFYQIDRKRQIGWHTCSPGIQVFVFGLFKKIVLADRLSVFVNQVYGTPAAFGSITVFGAAIAYSLQIYFDFSGYSDMAVGVAKVLGMELPRNFNLPYLSHNVTEFWKRWHITLSSWLQDYLYISWGGGRKGRFRMYGNLMMTMVLGGLWHGANWTYIIWGLLHGGALAIHKFWMDRTGSARKQHVVAGNIVSIALTFLFTSFCWIFFRADSFSHALIIIHRMFQFEPGLEQPYLWLFVGLILLGVCSVAAVLRSRKDGVKAVKMNRSSVEGYYPILDLTKFWSLVVFFVFCGLTLCLAYTGGSPFIYGRY